MIYFKYLFEIFSPLFWDVNSASIHEFNQKSHPWQTMKLRYLTDA